MNTGIYQIINKINGKVYIGMSAGSFKERWQGKYNEHLSRAFKKYGKENFIFHILEEVEPIKELIEFRETWWIEFFDSTNKSIGYNFCKKGMSWLGLKHRVESKEKMRIWKKENYIGENNPNYGKKLSEETKQKIREKITGHIKSVETREKLSKSNKGKFIGNKNPMFGKHEDHPNAKLNWNKVAEMREMWATGLYTQRQIALKFQIKPAHTSHILNNKKWIKKDDTNYGIIEEH